MKNTIKVYALYVALALAGGCLGISGVGTIVMPMPSIDEGFVPLIEGGGLAGWAGATES